MHIHNNIPNMFETDRFSVRRGHSPKFDMSECYLICRNEFFHNVELIITSCQDRSLRFTVQKNKGFPNSFLVESRNP